MQAPSCSDSIPTIMEVFFSSPSSRRSEMSWWQDATCRLFCSLLTCRGPWPSSQTQQGFEGWVEDPLALHHFWWPQPGYSSYPDGELILHCSGAGLPSGSQSQRQTGLTPSVSLPALTWLCTRAFRAPSVFLGFDSLTPGPADQLLSAESVWGAIYLVLLIFLLAFFVYVFFSFCAYRFTPSSKNKPFGNENGLGWYSAFHINWKFHALCFPNLILSSWTLNF